MKHTPEPWEHRHGGSSNYLDEVVATTNRGKKIVIARIPASAGRAAAFANACLIAAAPDMLSALEHVIRHHGGQTPDKECACDDCEYLAPVFAAMEKVKGKEEA
jgi:hypothetical protein